MNAPLIIVGAGGFGLEVAAYAQDASLTIKGFWDDSKPVGTLHAGFPVLSTTEATPDPDALYLIAVGAAQGRRTLAQKLSAQGTRFATLVHPTAYVAASAEIEEGAILAPFTFAGPESRVGPHVLMNIYASVAHESAIGAYSVLAPYAGTHACAIIGEEVFLGAQSVVTRDLRIGDQATLAAGSVLYTPLPAAAHAFGNPARMRG